LFKVYVWTTRILYFVKNAFNWFLNEVYLNLIRPLNLPDNYGHMLGLYVLQNEVENINDIGVCNVHYSVVRWGIELQKNFSKHCGQNQQMENTNLPKITATARTLRRFNFTEANMLNSFLIRYSLCKPNIMPYLI